MWKRLALVSAIALAAAGLTTFKGQRETAPAATIAFKQCYPVFDGPVDMICEVRSNRHRSPTAADKRFLDALEAEEAMKAASGLPTVMKGHSNGIRDGLAVAR